MPLLVAQYPRCQFYAQIIYLMPIGRNGESALREIRTADTFIVRSICHTDEFMGQKVHIARPQRTRNYNAFYDLLNWQYVCCGAAHSQRHDRGPS